MPIHNRQKEHTMSTEPKQLKEEIVKKEFDIETDFRSSEDEPKAIIIKRSSITDGFAFTAITNRDIVNTIKSTIQFITAGKDDICSKVTFDEITKATEKLLAGLKRRIDNSPVYFNVDTKMYSEGENTVEGLPIFSFDVFRDITESAIASVMPAVLAYAIDESVDTDAPVKALYGTTVITLTADDIATLFPVFSMKHEKEFYETDKDRSFMFPFRKDLIASFVLNALNAVKNSGSPATIPALQSKTYYDVFCQYINKGVDITDAKKYYQDANAEDAVYKTVFDELTIKKFTNHYESICRFSSDLIAISEQLCRNVIKEDEDGRNPYDIYRRDESDDVGSVPRYIDDCNAYDDNNSLAVFEAKGSEYLEMFSTVYCENNIQVCIDEYSKFFDKLIQLIYTDYNHTFVSTLVFLTLGRCHREMIERINQAIPDKFNVPKLKEHVQKYLNNQKEHGIDNLMEGWYNAIPSKYKTDALSSFIKGEGVFAETDKYLKKLSEWLLTGNADSRTDFVLDVKTQYIIGEASGVTGQDVVNMLINTKRAIDGSLYLTYRGPESEYCSLSGVDVMTGFGYSDSKLNTMNETNPATRAYYISNTIDRKKEAVDNFVLRPDAYFVVVELMHAIYDVVLLKRETLSDGGRTPHRDDIHYALKGLFYLINRFKKDFPTPDETWEKTLLELEKGIKVSSK